MVELALAVAPTAEARDQEVLKDEDWTMPCAVQRRNASSKQ